MKYSTGRNTRVRHSTATKEDGVNRRNHRRPRPRFSTSRASTMNHFTGAKSDGGVRRSARGQRPNRPPPGNRPSLRERSGERATAMVWRLATRTEE